MPNPIINTDGITDEEKTNPKFQFVYQGMLAQLNQPAFSLALCAHEAAHLVYFTKAGLTAYKAMPARVEYDPLISDYVGSLASVQILEMPQWKEGEFAGWFNLIACALVAGGVTARKLMPSTDGGDEDDRARFKNLCATINRDPNMSIDAEREWRDAKERVLKDLERPETLNDILKQALVLRDKLGL